MKKSSFILLVLFVFLTASVSTVLIACENNTRIVDNDVVFGEDCPVPGKDSESITDSELPPESFVGTVIEEDTHYMVVEPNTDEEEYRISKKIRVEYLNDHIDYLYGKGRKVVITYIPPIEGGKTIVTDDIRHDGFEDFTLSVQYYEDKLPVTSSAMPYSDRYITLVANNRDFNCDSSDYNLYYLGLYDVYVTVDKTTLPLKEALFYGKVTLDGIIAECNRLSSLGIIQDEVFKDGGSTIYDFGDFRILKYHTLDGNRDIFIGKPEMTIDAINATSLCIRGYEWKDWGLRLEAKNTTPSGTTVCFKQSGGSITGKLQTGEAFYLERRLGNMWVAVNTNPLIDYAFHMVAYGIPEGGSFEIKTGWDWLYDKLEKGQYRILKEVMDFRKTADFDKQIYYAYFNIE